MGRNSPADDHARQKSQSPVQRVYCCMEQLCPQGNDEARKVAIPCSKGLLLHEAAILAEIGEELKVAIPCSKGLLLHE